jgi:hypothetical protein
MNEGQGAMSALLHRRRFVVAVLLAAMSIVAAACVPPPPPSPQGTITGALSNGSIPLTQHGLLVTDVAGNTVASTNTNGSGNYAVQVPPGNYKINFLGASPCFGEWFSDKPDLASANVVSVADGASVTANGVLNCPTISGHVTNSNGQPLTGVGVQAFGAAFPLPSLPASTDANGFYRVFVGPGDYKVRFVDGAGCTEWFSDEPSMSTADLVSVPSGGGATVNAVFGCGTITGTVDDGTDPLPAIDVFAFDAAGNIVGDAVTESDGGYVMRITPGSYNLYFQDGDTGACNEWYSDKSDQTSADEVVVAAGAQVTANAAIACASISGTITDGTNPTPFVRVELKDGLGEWVSSRDTDQAGTYRFYVAPGTYKLYFDTPNADEWFDDHSNSETADLITVEAGEHFVADAVIGEGQIEGYVTDASNAPIPNAVVNVYDAAGNPVVSWTTDNDGYYATSYIDERDYFVEFKHPDFVTEWWNNQPNLGSANAVHVTVGGLTTASAVLTHT